MFAFRRLKYVADVRFSNVDKLSEPDEIPVRLCNYTDVYKNERISNDMPFLEATATSAEIRRFGLQVGDVILTKDSESPTDIAVPAVVVSTAPDLVCGYHLAVARPRTTQLNGRFLLRALQASGVREQFYVQANGVTRFGLSQAAIGNALVPVPSLDEQARIADFLDRKTASIDALIAKQEQLLALLAEKRQALITQAVTKGLDPNAPTKESGVDWIGDMPAHWSVMPTKLLGWYRGGAGFPDDEQGQTHLPLPFYKVRDLSDEAIREDVLGDGDHTIDHATARRLRATVFPPGTIVFAKVGAALLLRRFRTLRRDACIDNNMMGWVLNPAQMTTAYALLATSLLRFDLIVNPGTVPSLNGSVFGRQPMPVPPLDEQERIVTHVRSELRRLDGLAQRAAAMVDKLREYRQALITAAVTGQLDVTSGAAATSAPKPYAEAVGT